MKKISFTLFLLSLVSFSTISLAQEIKIRQFDVETNTESEGFIEDVDMGIDIPGAGLEPTTPFDPSRSIGVPPKENRTIFGKDDRYNVDTTKYPYSAVARLYRTANGYEYTGTAFFIAPNVLLTAAHCVYNNGGWTVGNMKIQPGYNFGFRPFGEIPLDYNNLEKITIMDNWAHNGGAYNARYDTAYDLAIIKLKKNFGNATGSFNMSGNVSSTAQVTGYPGDQSKYGGMYSSSGKITSYDSDFIYSQIDSTGGHSGGPVHNNGTAFAINIAESTSRNTGIRLQNNLNFIKLSAGFSPSAKKVDKMVTIKSPNYTIWQNFVNWKKKSDTSNKKDNTYRVKFTYDHFNGETYYSLYDSNNVWQGYINKTGVNELVAEKFDKNVSVRSETYNIWQNFFWKKKSDTKGKLGRVYKARFKYKHPNGNTYYSLYDSTGTSWQGYINATGTVEMNAVSYNKKVTITKSTYNIWGNFFFNTKNGHTSNHVGKTYDAKFVYTLGDGVKYYSLYSGSNWLGYLNTGATQMARSLWENNDDDKYEEPINTEESSNEDGNIDPIELDDESDIESSTDSSAIDLLESSSSEDDILESSLNE